MSGYDFYGRLFMIVIVVQTILLVFSIKKDTETIKTQQYYQTILLEKLNGED